MTLNVSKATHVMGGHITWECQGDGSFIFELTILRDCNGVDLADPNKTIDVWNHPSLTSIVCNFVSREDISPNCTEVAGSPVELDCGTGNNAGNGAGAIDKFTYRSAPIFISGTPPPEGWSFTYDDFSRNWNLTNIASPSSLGLTVASTMYPYQGKDTNPCFDSSPMLGQSPRSVICTGSAYEFNQNATDPDLDSVVYSFGQPWDQLGVGNFDPPTNPALAPFTSGFSFDNPTPDASFNASNVPASLDPQTGLITFQSFSSGNFAIKTIVESYRNGTKISEVQIEFQLILVDCPNYNNNKPIIIPPFAGNTSFELDVFAGDLVQFDLNATDVELLQDGSPQSNILTPSGQQFGTNFTDPNSGCDILPCATMNAAMPLVQPQGITSQFNWLTACEHLVNSDGEALEEASYQFVFKVEDDYCQIPENSFATVTINLKNRPRLDPIEFYCANVLANGDVELTWSQATDINGSFDSYEIHTVQDGLVGTVNNINTTTFTHNGAGANLLSKDYFIVLKCGCDGIYNLQTETISTMFLDVINPGDGTAILQWNSLHDPILPTSESYLSIYREYPTGVWTLLDTVPYGTLTYRDTIDICDAFLNYQIQTGSTEGCFSGSSIDGEQLQDILAPLPAPTIESVSVDTLTGNSTVTWHQHHAPDTYGYLVYQLINGFWEAIDTIWTITDTVYENTSSSPFLGSENYQVAAFDSCLNNDIPPFYQTSAKSVQHNTIFLETTPDICNKTVELSWNSYDTWAEGISSYEIYAQPNGSSRDVIGTTTSTTFTAPNIQQNIATCFIVKAISNNGKESFSNEACQQLVAPTQPSEFYIQTASVNESNEVEVKTHVNPTSPYFEIMLERDDLDGEGFYDLTQQIADFSPLHEYDLSAEVNEQSYQYRVTLIDSCGDRSIESNIAKTILLRLRPDNDELTVTLDWSLYEGFNGEIISYNIYRGIDGVFSSSPIANVTPQVRSYIDDVSEYYTSTGEFCYRVEAVENYNIYGISETAFSNSACQEIKPLIFIPNTFIVNGPIYENSIFKPVISYFDFYNYDLQIMDRWGDIIFQSNNYEAGWDGYTKRDKVAEQGVYIYIISFKDGAGEDHIAKGHVTLLNETDD